MRIIRSLLSVAFCITLVGSADAAGLTKTPASMVSGIGDGTSTQQNASGTVTVIGGTAPTQTAGDATTAIANDSFVGTAVLNLKTYVLGFLQANYTLQVPTKAALAATVGFSGVTAHRSGFYAAGDGGGADYFWLNLACGATGTSGPSSDGGSCVTAAGGGSWNADFGYYPPSIKVWGAQNDSNGTTGNGTDNTTFVQNALNWALGLSRKLYIPGGAKQYRFSSRLSAAGNFSFVGDNADTSTLTGSWLFFDHTDYGILTAGTAHLESFGTTRPQPTPANTGSFTGNTTSGSTSVTNLSSTTYVAVGYGIQGTGIPAGATISSVSGTTLVLSAAATTTTTSDALSTFKNYVPCSCNFDISQVAGEIYIHDVYTLNPSKQLDIQTGRQVVDGLRGQPLQIGIELDDVEDTATQKSHRIWPYWTINPNVLNYTRSTLLANLFYRVDNPEIVDEFDFAAATCVQYGTGSKGITSQANFVNFGCDDYGVNGITYASASGTSSIYSSSYVFSDPYAAGSGISMDSNSGTNTLTINGFRISNYSPPAGSSAVLVAGSGDNIWASGLQINGWGGPAGQPAIGMAAGSYFILSDLVPNIVNGPSATSPLFGGGAYSGANGALTLMRAGSGFVEVSAGASGGPASFAFAGGGVTAGIVGAGTPFVAIASGNTTATQKAATASGKISLGYYTDQSPPGYYFYNNSGSAVNYTYRQTLTGQNN